MSVRRVIYDQSRDLWVYEDNGKPATLADTRASLAARSPLIRGPRRTRQWDEPADEQITP